MSANSINSQTSNIRDSKSHIVLIVDDDWDQLNLYETLLKKNGYEVIKSPTAQEALDTLSNIHVDLVISDVLMPGISGKEFVQRARTARGLSNLPIISLTAGASQFRDELLSVGVDGFLSKSCSTSELLSEIASLLNQQEETGSLLQKICDRFAE